MYERMLCLGGEHHGTVVEVKEGLPVIRFSLADKASLLKNIGLVSPPEPREESYRRCALRYRGVDNQHIPISKRWDFFVHESAMRDPDFFESVDVFVINQLVSIAMTKGI